MKTITYNPETHVLVPRDLIADAKQIFCSDVEPNTNGDCLDVIEWFNAMMAVAPQPEPNPNWCAGCSPDNCPGCWAEPVYQICMADSVNLSRAWIDVDKQTYHDAGLYKEYKLRLLYTTPQPDRTAELEAVLKVARDALNDCEGALDECRDYPITYNTILEALAKINEVLK